MSGRIGDITARLHGLHPRLIDLTLDRLRALLAKLDHPERRLPPVIHVAGTNGKGSTCAFLRAMGEAAGLRVHVFTSPHLLRLNERIRLAGEEVSDAALIDALERTERANDGAPITVFEVLTAAAFLLFAETPANLCVLEVGLGGRGDATNVVERPAACAITSISLDHQDFLGDTLEKIAAEKAGIMKPGVPVAIGAQRPEVLEVLLASAAAVGAPVIHAAPDGLPAPALPGAHQRDNAAIAAAAIRAADIGVNERAIAAGIASAEWPARLQRLRGALAASVPDGWELWLDGGHNPGAAEILAAHFAQWSDRPLHLIVGMKATKDPAAFLRPLIPHAASITAVAEPEQHLALPVEAIVAASGGVAVPGPTVADALARLRGPSPTPRPPPEMGGGEAALTSPLPSREGLGVGSLAPARILICGSLYLAGEVLRADRGS